MEKLIKKLTKLNDDFNLHRYLKNHPEVARGMTVKEVNSLIDSLGTGEPILPGANMPQRSYQAVLASVKSNIAAGRAVDGREM